MYFGLPPAQSALHESELGTGVFVSEIRRILSDDDIAAASQYRASFHLFHKEGFRRLQLHLGCCSYRLLGDILESHADIFSSSYSWEIII